MTTLTINTVTNFDLPSTVSELRSLANKLEIKWKNFYGKNLHMKKADLLKVISEVFASSQPADNPVVEISTEEIIETEEVVETIETANEENLTPEFYEIENLDPQIEDTFNRFEEMFAVLAPESLEHNEKENATSFGVVAENTSIRTTLLLWEATQLPYYFTEEEFENRVELAKTQTTLNPNQLDEMLELIRVLCFDKPSKVETYKNEFTTEVYWNSLAAVNLGNLLIPNLGRMLNDTVPNPDNTYPNLFEHIAHTKKSFREVAIGFNNSYYEMLNNL